MYSSGMDTNWSTPVWLSGDTPSVSSANPNIVIDKNGRPFIGWCDETKGQIFYTYLSSGTWTTPQPIGSGFYGLRMAVDVQNNIHAVWHDGNSNLLYSKWNWLSWSAPYTFEADSSIDKAWPDIAIDSKGNIHVVAMEYRLSQGDPLTYFISDGTGWRKQPNPPNPTTGQSCNPRISFGIDDTIHLVWEERYADYVGYYTYSKNNTWSSPRRLIDSINVSAPQMVYINNQIYIIWSAFETQGIGIYWSTRDSFGGWSLPQPITTAYRAYQPAMTYDQKGKIHAIWPNAGIIEYSSNVVDTGMECDPGDTLNGCLFYLSILKCMPMPAQSQIKLVYSLKVDGTVAMLIYNVIGQRIKEIHFGNKTKGTHENIIKLDSAIVTGTYFYRLVLKENDYTTKINKLTIIK